MSSVQAESIVGIPEPRHFPEPMGRYGKNPYGENLYRVVFAPSCFRLVGGTWPDGRAEYRLAPKYRDLGNVWVLEKWISAFEDSGMTEATYNLHFREVVSGLLVNGPYPHRGVYHHVHTFESVQPGDCNIEWIVNLIKKAKTNDPVKVREAVEAEQERRKQERHQQGIDKLNDLRPAFGMRPTSLPGGGVHSTKSFQFKWDAADLTGVPRKGARKGA